MFSSKAWRGLPLAAGAWLAAGVMHAAAQPGLGMPLGRAAQPPRGFVEFCARTPGECGERAEVLVKVRRLAGRSLRRALTASPAALAPSSATDERRQIALLTSGVERAVLQTQVDFTSRDGAGPAGLEPLPMSVELWTLLKTINTRVNASIVSRADEETYGVADFWTMPLENGRQEGDCEDYVLEKRRALLAAGLDPRTLNIALTTTAWGETHAVLLVATSQGDYVLDNLSPWIRRWDLSGYTWLERQVDGDAFRWARVKPQPTKAAQNAPADAKQG